MGEETEMKRRAENEEIELAEELEEEKKIDEEKKRINDIKLIEKQIGFNAKEEEEMKTYQKELKIKEALKFEEERNKKINYLKRLIEDKITEIDIEKDKTLVKEKMML